MSVGELIELLKAIDPWEQIYIDTEDRHSPRDVIGIRDVTVAVHGESPNQITHVVLKTIM